MAACSLQAGLRGDIVFAWEEGRQDVLLSSIPHTWDPQSRHRLCPGTFPLPAKFTMESSLLYPSPEPLGHCCAIWLLLARHDQLLARMGFPLCLSSS